MALRLGALVFGAAGKGCERSLGSVWPQGVLSLVSGNVLLSEVQYRAGMKGT